VFPSECHSGIPRIIQAICVDTMRRPGNPGSFWHLPGHCGLSSVPIPGDCTESAVVEVCNIAVQLARLPGTSGWTSMLSAGPALALSVSVLLKHPWSA